MKIVQPILINDAALISTNVSETYYTPFDAGVVYAKGDRVQVVSVDSHLVYESLVDANLGNIPADNPLKWIYVSFTNPWLMFDQSVTSQTTNADEIDVAIQAVGRVPVVALLNISAAEVEVTITDIIEGVIYDETFTLVSDSGVTDWYAYFFEPIVRLTDLTIVDLPLYASPLVEVSIRGDGELVKCGALIMGPSTDVGDSQYGAKVGIQDYSVKEQDDFGNYSIVPRAYSKTGSFDVLVPSTKVDTLQNFLASLRSIPVLYIGADGYTSTAVLGFYSSFEIQIAYPLYSICTIEVEGLT